MKSNRESLEHSHGGQGTASEFDLDVRKPKPVRTAHKLGGPLLLVRRILETWKLGSREQSILLGLDASDQASFQEFITGNAANYGRDARDRIAYLIQIRNTLFALFRDDEVENEWLRETHTLLGDRAPMDLLLEGSMANLLLVKEYCDEVGGMWVR